MTVFTALVTRVAEALGVSLESAASMVTAEAARRTASRFRAMGLHAPEAWERAAGAFAEELEELPGEWPPAEHWLAVMRASARQAAVGATIRASHPDVVAAAEWLAASAVRR